MKKLVGSDGFDAYYSELYGDRWKNLKQSLYGESHYVEWKPDYTENTYFLDSASVLTAYSLPLANAKNILDMCSAPGGKSLILAHRMERTAQLLCNERSSQRRNRLVNVLNTHLSEEIRERVKVSSNDGSIMCKKESEAFDAILLDAPCSSERHVLTDTKYLDQWTSSRIKNLSIAQWALLSSAFRLLKTGGKLVYSTCALAKLENDEVVRKLTKKFDNAKVQQIDFSAITSCCSHTLPIAEKTEFGYHVLPDTQNGAGPLYFSLIEKN